MHQHLQEPIVPTDADVSELTSGSSLAQESAEVSAGAALTEAQTEDRQWREKRRRRLSGWIRKASRWGLMAEAASRVAGYLGLLLGVLALVVALPFAPLATLIGGFALASLLAAPLFLAVSWLCYIGLGVLSRWAKREAILDELPSRRPLLWPGAPRPK